MTISLSAFQQRVSSPSNFLVTVAEMRELIFFCLLLPFSFVLRRSEASGSSLPRQPVRTNSNNFNRPGADQPQVDQVWFV